MKTPFARTLTALGTALVFGASFAAPAAHAAQPMPMPVTATAAAGPLASSVEQHLAQRDLGKAVSLAQDPTPAPAAAPAKDRGFFSGPRGALAIGLMVVGTAWVVKSTFSDRIDNPVRQ